MILVYTGNGKGKTSAGVGQAVRAHGRGLTVAFGQFMKRPEQAGEQKVCEMLFAGRFYAGGPGFLRREEERPAHREAALTTLRWAEEQLAEVDMLVLDECLYALGNTLITDDELQALVQRAKEADAHLVLTGRGAPPWLLEQADLITEMREVKHPYHTGQKALPGIEF